MRLGEVVKATQPVRERESDSEEPSTNVFISKSLCCIIHGEAGDTVSAIRYKWKAMAHVPTATNLTGPQTIDSCPLSAPFQWTQRQCVLSTGMVRGGLRKLSSEPGFEGWVRMGEEMDKR